MKTINNKLNILHRSTQLSSVKHVKDTNFFQCNYRLEIDYVWQNQVSAHCNRLSTKIWSLQLTKQQQQQKQKQLHKQHHHTTKLKFKTDNNSRLLSSSSNKLQQQIQQNSNKNNSSHTFNNNIAVCIIIDTFETIWLNMWWEFSLYINESYLRGDYTLLLSNFVLDITFKQIH